MELLYTIFDYLRDWLIIIYCVSFVVAVYKYKEINSTVIVVSLLFCLECISGYIQEPLLAVRSWEAWYGTWIALDAVFVLALYEAHKVLKVNLAKLANTVALAQIISTSVQVTRYMERCFFQGDRLDPWYYVTINSINVSVVIIVVFTLIREKEEKRVGLYI